MLAEFPLVQIPDSLGQLCALNLKNSRKSYSDIYEIIEADPFLNLLVKDVFAPFIKKGGILGMLTALGWEGVRNRLAEAYIYFCRHKKFPSLIELDEVNDVLDIEKRFDFLYSELNSRVFMLGMYLKLCQVNFEDDPEFQDHDFITIPSEVDEILILGKSKSLNPDWLIIIVWSFYQLFGQEKTAELLLLSKGNMDLIFEKITTEDYEKVIESLLKYGHAVNDTQFFVSRKV
jgi:hypothetical protein